MNRVFRLPLFINLFYTFVVVFFNALFVNVVFAFILDFLPTAGIGIGF